MRGTVDARGARERRPASGDLRCSTTMAKVMSEVLHPMLESLSVFAEMAEAADTEAKDGSERESSGER